MYGWITPSDCQLWYMHWSCCSVAERSFPLCMPHQRINMLESCCWEQHLHDSVRQVATDEMPCPSAISYRTLSKAHANMLQPNKVRLTASHCCGWARLLCWQCIAQVCYRHCIARMHQQLTLSYFAALSIGIHWNHTAHAALSECTSAQFTSQPFTASLRPTIWQMQQLYWTQRAKGSFVCCCCAVSWGTLSRCCHR